MLSGHVVARLAGGGGANVVASALGIESDRYETWIFGGDREGEDALWDAAAAGGVRIVVSPGMGPGRGLADVAALLRLIRLLRTERFTIVHTHSRKAGIIGGIAARLCRVPVIVHSFHTRVFRGIARTPPYGRVEPFVRRLAHAHIAVSPGVARQAVEARAARPGRITVVASGVDLAGIPRGFDPDARRALGVPSDVTLIGTVGRIASEKAHTDFVRMASQVRRTHSATAFVLIGDGPLASSVRNLAADLGIELIMTGHRADAARLCAGFDVFVMTSIREGLGRALVEALASARPCVATAVDGVPDLVAHGVTGLLVAPGDPAAAVRAVHWMIDNPPDATQLGRSGRSRVRHAHSPFTIEAMCASIDRCYQSMLGLPEEIAQPPGGTGLTTGKETKSGA